jgi:tetratricopeptide (TPR) repeat protein
MSYLTYGYSMIYREKHLKQKELIGQALLGQPIYHAQRFIKLFHQVESPNEEQRLMLAAAHYMLANQLDISLPLCRFHANSAVTVLQNIQNKKESWQSQIAQAYFRRAELLEEENAYCAASHDYQRAIEAIENQALLETDPPQDAIPIFDKVKASYRAGLSDHDKLMLSKCAISIADLIINDQITYQQVKHAHPLFYINKALEYLNEIQEHDEEMFAIQSYAHQLAGIALNVCDFDASKGALQEALHMAFKSDPDKTYHLLTDIYNCLGLLYESKFKNNIIQNPKYVDLDEAMIYFGIALLFTKTYADDDEEENDQNILDLESLFEIIYRVLDPFLPSLSKSLLFNLIDGLIFAYMGLLEDNLPNEHLKLVLNNSETLDIFAQHIYWLVTEAYHKNYSPYTTLTIFDPNTIDTRLDQKQLMAVIKNNTNNVHYMHHFKAKKIKLAVPILQPSY